MNHSLANAAWPLPKGDKWMLIIRHAKSSWAAGVRTDFERPLNDRGLQDAPEMGRRLLQKGMVPQVFLSSPANRAQTTARLMATAMQYPEAGIVLLKELYHAPVPVFYDVIAQVSNAIDSVAIFSHNPGITEFVNELSPQLIPNMPTCGVFAVKATIQHWADFAAAPKEMLFFDYPKAI
jgi:phosphohistidine phosphatase